MRRTKIICTIGPKTADYNSILKLASHGMDIARLNMSHGDHLFHRKSIQAIKTINSKGIYSIATMLDTKGPEIRTGDVKEEIQVERGEEFIFTVKPLFKTSGKGTTVNYDGFVEDIKIDDIILVDGGLVSFRVMMKNETDIVTEVLESGRIGSRRHINIKGRSARLPTITNQDWIDIDFAIREKVDFIALSFVKSASVVRELKKYLAKHKGPIDIIAKIESAASIPHLDGIIKESDGIMVARGDLGAELPLEEIPLLQEEILKKCLAVGRPVIVATQLLESMIENPTPTRAEVTDIALSIREHADAIMLSGETAIGDYPFKAVALMDTVAKHIERKMQEDKKINIPETDNPKIEMVRSATIIANNLSVKAILVFTRRGYTATLVSWCRPNSPIYAFTNMTSVRRRLNLYWGVVGLRLEFSKDPEKTIKKAIDLLKRKEQVKKDDRLIIVSDILAGEEFVETIQVRRIG